MDEWPVTYRRKVRFSDTDAQSIVFNGNYFTYWDDTITDYFEALGIEWSDFTKRGFDMVLARAEVDFRSAARLGDTVATGARVSRFGTTSITFELTSWIEATGEVVVEGRETQVVIDHESMRPVPIPAFFIEAVRRLQNGRPARD